jgi:integrase
MTDATSIRAVVETPATQARHGPLRAGAAASAAPAPKPKLLDQVRDAIRTRHYSYRTEQAYVGWIRRFILFHGKRHPAEMGKPEIEQFLTGLAVQRNVAASTQNQALAAILFLYKDVLTQDPGWLDDVVRAKRPRRLPVVLTREEVKAILAELDGRNWIMVMLLYGAGLRLVECLSVRVKDIDFSRNEILVRDGKGQKDRHTMLPAAVKEALGRHLEQLRPSIRSTCGAATRRFTSRMRLPESIRTHRPTGLGNGSFRPPISVRTHAQERSAGSTSMNPCCSARSRRPCPGPALASTSVFLLPAARLTVRARLRAVARVGNLET